MAFIDLSVKGNPSPRHERPFSGKRSGYANRNANTKANIFGTNDEDFSAKRAISKSGVKLNQKSPVPSRQSIGVNIQSPSVISKSDLESTKQLVGLMEEKKAESLAFQVNGKLYVGNPHRPRSRKAPEGVPRLQLGALADGDDELQNPLKNYVPNVGTPDSQTSVSWGTPMNNQHYVNGKDETSFQVCVEKPEERLLSEQRRKPNGIPDLDLQLSHSGNEQFRKALRERNEREREMTKKVEPSSKITETSSGHVQQDTGMTMKVADEKAKLRMTRKNEIIDQALLGDELTRETEVARVDNKTSSSFLPNNGRPRQRRHEDLFNRNPTATTSVSLALLNQRVRFSARIVSKNGHDAHRELNGFYFLADKTLTVYEFRQFGSRYSALPFIQRAKYHHVKGHVKTEVYTCQDIHVGNDLVFKTADQLSLPGNLKSKNYVTLRITDVDEDTKQKFAFQDRHTPLGVVPPSHELLQRNMSEDQKRDKELIANVNAMIRKQLKKRGVKTLTGLGKHFQSLDTTGDGHIDKCELKEALQKFNIQMPSEKFDEIWNIVDENHDGVLDYGEFMRNFIGEMNEKRKALVLKIFRKMDPNKRGVIPLTNLAKFYNARQHPAVIAGTVNEDEMFSQLLDSFEHCKKNGEVSYSNFEDYFEGLSLTVEDDDEFTTIMRNCWAI